ncbi:MAG: oligosaccharide flippase family protein [Deltaproteobacteria bacterium]|nr:oligosaccharide flippase family protein [Deltaproteobacteria bacterium]
MAELESQSKTAKVILLSLGQCFASASGFVITAVLSRYFSKHDYASYRQVLLCFSMALPFLSLGIPVALYYFLPTEKERPRGVISENLILQILLGSLFVVFLYAGGAPLLAQRMDNYDIVILLYVFAPYAIVQMLRSSLPGCFMSADKPKLLASFNAVSRFAECVFIVLAVIIFKTILSVLVVTVIAGLLALTVGVVAVFRLYRSGPVMPSVAGIKDQLTYGAPLGLAAVFGSIMGYLDQLIVSLKCTPEAFAIYVNGAVRIPLLSVVVMSVTAVLLPELNVMYKKADKAGMLQLWQNAMVKSSFVVIPVTAFLMILADDAIALVFSQKYLASVPVFRVFLLLLPFQMISYGPIFHASNNNKYIVVINLVTLAVHIPLLFFCIGYLGIIGAAAITVFSQVCIRILLHILFIGRIVERPLWSIIPFAKLNSVFVPALLFALPLMVRYLLDMAPAVSIGLCALYYYPVCYLWLTRKAQAPTISHVEKVLLKCSFREVS